MESITMLEQKPSLFRLNLVTWMITGGMILVSLSIFSIDMEAVRQGSPSLKDFIMLLNTVAALVGVVTGQVFWWREWKRLRVLQAVSDSTPHPSSSSQPTRSKTT